MSDSHGGVGVGESFLSIRITTLLQPRKVSFKEVFSSKPFVCGLFVAIPDLVASKPFGVQKSQCKLTWSLAVHRSC